MNEVTPGLAGEQMRPIDKLIVMVFRLNGSLLEGGSRLVEDIGLTPAWWQVLGALQLSPVPLTVPQIARNIGLTRQSVQRIVDLLMAKQFIQLESNPHHRRARLVVMSEAGKIVFLRLGGGSAPGPLISPPACQPRHWRAQSRF